MKPQRYYKKKGKTNGEKLTLLNAGINQLKSNYAALGLDYIGLTLYWIMKNALRNEGYFFLPFFFFYYALSVKTKL